MIRFLASGYRDFEKYPVPVNERLNWEFYAVTDGQMAPVFADKKDIPLKSKYLWVMSPGLSYGWRSGKKPPMRYVIHFTSVPAALRQVTEGRGYFGRAIDSKEIRQIETLYRQIEKRTMSFDPICALELERAVIDLTLLFLKGVKLGSTVPLDKIDENRIESILAWYNEHMSEYPTINAAASVVNLSAGHLRRTFHRVRGCSPHEAFMSLRLERAKELLSTTSDDLVQVGRACGFGSDSDFCRVFSKYTGVSPHKWRTNITAQEAGGMLIDPRRIERSSIPKKTPIGSR